MSHLGHETSYRGNINLMENRKVKDIRLCGVGALGSFLADILARQGYENMTLIDAGKVDYKDFGTQNYGKTDIGRSRPIQCSHNLMRKLGVKSKAEHKLLTAMNSKSLLSTADLVVDLFDNVESSTIVKVTCEMLNIPCVHVYMGSDFAEICWNDSYQARETTDVVSTLEHRDYPLATNLVYFTISILSEVINSFIDLGTQRDVGFTLKNMNINIRREK